MKRFLLTVGILFGCALLFFFGTALVLAMAPGSSIFGVQYVSAFVGSNVVEEEWASYINGDIYVNAKDVPVIIDVRNYSKTKVTFSQKYQGYTIGASRVPNCDIEKTNKGIEITTHEIEKFLIGGSKEYALTITIPASWATSGTHSIYVQSNHSNVTFSSENGNESTLRFKNIELNAGANVAFNCPVKCKNLDFYTANSQTLNEKVSADDYNIRTSAGDITFVGNCVGDIKVTSQRGSVKFVSCQNATIKTTSGKVYGDSPVVYGKADISTDRGGVVLGEVLGENSTITTHGGSIVIGNFVGGKLVSPRGKIKITEVVNTEIVGGVNDVIVERVAGSATISTTRGNIYIGSEGGAEVVGNVSATSSSGNIVATKTAGTLTFNTDSGDVKLSNGSSANITIESARRVEATGLVGKVVINASGACDLGFSKITDAVKVAGLQNCSKIKITVDDALANSNLNIKINGKSKFVGKVYAGEELKQSGQNVAIKEAGTTAPTLEVEAGNCNVSVYYNA